MYLLEHCKDSKDKAVLESIESMKNILYTIREELRVLQQEMETHKKRWFSGWRCDESGKMLARLRRHKRIFMERVNLFYHLNKL